MNLFYVAYWVFMQAIKQINYIFFFHQKTCNSVVYKIQFLYAQVEVIYIHASAGWKKIGRLINPWV